MLAGEREKPPKSPKIVVLACVAWLALLSPAADPALAHAAPRTAAPDRPPRLCRVSAPAHAWHARGKPNGLAAEIAKFRRLPPALRLAA